MNAHATALAFARALASAAGLESCHVYAHDTLVLEDGSTQSPVEEMQLPAVFVKIRFDGLAGSTVVGKARVEIDVESQCDESTSAEHSDRETAIRQTMSDMGALTNAFAAVATVTLLGKPCLVENSPDAESRAYKTPYTFLAGVRSIA